MDSRKETLEGIQRLVRLSRSKSLSPKDASINTPKILDDLRSMSQTGRGSTHRGLRRVKSQPELQGRVKTNYMSTLGALHGNVNQTHPDTDEGVVEKIAKRGLTDLIEAAKKKKVTKKAPKKKVVRKKGPRHPNTTGAPLEKSLVTTGEHISTGGSGAQTTDLHARHARGTTELEAKGGSHDQEQMTISGTVQRDKKGKISKLGLDKPRGKTANKHSENIGRITGHIASRLRRHLTGKSYDPATQHRGKHISELGKTFTGRKKDVKGKVSNKVAHALLGSAKGGDPVQVHACTKTGRIAVVPVSNKHQKHTEAMGLKKQPSLEQMANNPKERRSSLGFGYRYRRKETRANASLTGNSTKIIDAVERHGGQVFQNHKEYHAHMKKNNVKVRSGHAN